MLTIFVPGGFHVDMTGGALIGRTPQKLCQLTSIIFFKPKNNKKVKFASKMLFFGPIEYDCLSKNGEYS
jgi:hypothetical protein